MKKTISILLFLCVSLITMAQDVIVKKDGSTILAKVLEVTSADVKYKKHTNVDGPTYTIKKKEIQRINYENGEKDKSVSSNYNPNIVTNETATQFSDDKKLLDMYKNRNKKFKTPEMLYKKGKRMKVAGYTVGGTLLVGGIVSIIIGASKEEYEEELWCSYNNIRHHKYYNDDRNTYFYVGFGTMAASMAVGVPLILKGSSLQKKYGEQVHSVSTISQDINFGNGTNLNLGIDLLSSNQSYTKTPGIGVRYNF